MLVEFVLFAPSTNAPISSYCFFIREDRFKVWYDDGEAYWELLDQVEILENTTPKPVFLKLS